VLLQRCPENRSVQTLGTSSANEADQNTAPNLLHPDLSDAEHKFLLGLQYRSRISNEAVK
jgi:hypothetical protein